ncbi:MAG TPA: hypothetical protein DIW30_07290 [Bacteroidales bacterium]|nr:hypothetical protein [Bacteroidales bacterium]
MQEKETYIVNLNSLQEGTYEKQFHLEDDFFSRKEAKELLGGDCLAKVELLRKGDDFRLEMQIKGNVRCVCDRCLDEVMIPMDCEETLSVRLGRMASGDEDVVWVDPMEGNLDLAWLLYELVEINLPIVIRHQEGGCNPQMEELLQSHLCSLKEDDDENRTACPET